jgi:hypothetical protein
MRSHRDGRGRDRRGDALVVEDEVSALQGLQRAQRQQIRIS